MSDAPPVLAWHSDPDLKAATVERMRKHRAADEFVQRWYVMPMADDGGRWKGCFIGCLVAEAVAAERGVRIPELRRTTTWWAETQRLFGIPISLAAALDEAFECADEDAAGDFAVAVTEAIPVGADLSALWQQLAAEDLNAEAFGGHARIIELLKAAPVPALVKA